MNVNLFGSGQDINEEMAWPKSAVCWNAIFAGVVIAVVSTVLLNILGIGLGFRMVSLVGDSIRNVSGGTFIWFILSGSFSMLLGGWLASSLANSRSSLQGVLHGIVMWGLTTLLALVLTTATFGVLIGGSLNILGQTIIQSGEVVGSLGKSLAQQVPVSDIKPNIKSEISSMVQSIQQEVSQNSTSNKDINKLLQEDLMSLFSAENDQAIAVARQKTIELLTQNMGLDSQQAEQKVNDWLQKFNDKKEQVEQKSKEAKEKTIVVAEKATNTLGTLAIGTFFTLFMGAIASGIGGLWGTRRAATKSKQAPEKT